MHDAAIEAGLVERPERVVTDDEFNYAYREELAAQVERMKLDRTVAELEQLEEEGEVSAGESSETRGERASECARAKCDALRTQILHLIAPATIPTCRADWRSLEQTRSPTTNFLQPLCACVCPFARMTTTSSRSCVRSASMRSNRHELPRRNEERRCVHSG